MDICLPVLKESKKNRFDSYCRQEQCIGHIPYCHSGLSCAHFFPTTFLEIAVYETVSTKQRQESFVILSRNLSGPFFKLCMI